MVFFQLIELHVYTHVYVCMYSPNKAAQIWIIDGEVHNHVYTLSQVSARTGAGYGDISSVVQDIPNGPRKLYALYFCMQ